MASRRRRDQWPKLCAMVEQDDGLPVQVYGQWTEEKLHFWNRYVEITTAAMVGHPAWAAGLVYVDLFAGPGVCAIKESGRRLPGSPLIAACAPKPFREILLCELSDESMHACEERIRRLAPECSATFFRGDCNERIGDIVRRIPNGALTLAFIDPQGLDFSFDTIRRLAQRGRVDLLILIADAVDFARNVDTIYYGSLTLSSIAFSVQIQTGVPGGVLWEILRVLGRGASSPTSTRIGFGNWDIFNSARRRSRRVGALSTD